MANPRRPPDLRHGTLPCSWVPRPDTLNEAVRSCDRNTPTRFALAGWPQTPCAGFGASVPLTRGRSIPTVPPRLLMLDSARPSLVTTPVQLVGRTEACLGRPISKSRRLLPHDGPECVTGHPIGSRIPSGQESGLSTGFMPGRYSDKCPSRRISTSRCGRLYAEDSSYGRRAPYLMGKAVCAVDGHATDPLPRLVRPRFPGQSRTRRQRHKRFSLITMHRTSRPLRRQYRTLPSENKSDHWAGQS